VQLQSLINLLLQKEGQYKRVKSLIEKNTKDKEYYNKQLLNILKAEEIIKLLANTKQKRNIKYIETICTNSINAIFEEDISFKIELVHERNKVGFRFFIVDNKTGYKTNPKINEAGGLRDILSFALRVSLWGLQQNKMNLLILDEPFSAFNLENIKKAGMLIKELSQKLNIQFIIATHKKDLFVDDFGKLVNITKKGKGSEISK